MKNTAFCFGSKVTGRSLGHSVVLYYWDIFLSSGTWSLLISLVLIRFQCVSQCVDQASLSPWWTEFLLYVPSGGQLLKSPVSFHKVLAVVFLGPPGLCTRTSRSCTRSVQFKSHTYCMYPDFGIFPVDPFVRFPLLFPFGSLKLQQPTTHPNKTSIFWRSSITYLSRPGDFHQQGLGRA